MTGGGGNASIDRLADLADYDKIVHRASSQRSENIIAGRRQRPARIAGSVGEFRPGIRAGSIADAIISSNDAMCVGLDERHIHRFNHRRLSLQDNLVSGKPAEIISSGLE